MPYYQTRGKTPPKRHIELPNQPGFLDEGVSYEEVVSTNGFSRAYSILYHLRPPTRVLKVEKLERAATTFVRPEVLRHRHLKTEAMRRAGDPISGRVPLLGNTDVLISRCRPADPQQELYRNAAADEVIFVHAGRGVLRSPFGRLPFQDLDYIVIPRATTYLIEFEKDQEPDLLIVESSGSLTIPPHYLNQDGQLKLGAPFSERDLKPPRQLDTIDQDEPTAVVIKHDDQWTKYLIANHPFDVIGWDGCVYPFTFNALDFEPVTGRVHQPPPVHQTFEAPGFVLCTFAPRLLDTDPRAVKVPYSHSNVQADEVLYYVQGQFGSRRGVSPGSFTLHPSGVPHGPHPGTFRASRGVVRTEELAVMLDSVRPLLPTRESIEFDDPDYPLTWME